MTFARSSYQNDQRSHRCNGEKGIGNAGFARRTSGYPTNITWSDIAACVVELSLFVCKLLSKNLPAVESPKLPPLMSNVFQNVYQLLKSMGSTNSNSRDADYLSSKQAGNRGNRAKKCGAHCFTIACLWHWVLSYMMPSDASSIANQQQVWEACLWFHLCKFGRRVFNVLAHANTALERAQISCWQNKWPCPPMSDHCPYHIKLGHSSLAQQ